VPGELVNSPSFQVHNKKLHGHLLQIYASSLRVNIDDLIFFPILKAYDLILGCVFQECFNVITVAEVNTIWWIYEQRGSLLILSVFCYLLYAFLKSITVEVNKLALLC
jgi:hypothetical protein